MTEAYYLTLIALAVFIIYIWARVLWTNEYIDWVDEQMRKAEEKDEL